MPNWCNNTLTLDCEPQDFCAFVDTYCSGSDEDFDLDKVIETPPELLAAGSPAPAGKEAEFLTKYGANDWYQWRIQNWGTKWPPRIVSVDKVGQVIEFDSAWTPPIAALTLLAAKHKNIRFRLVYDEPGNELNGAVTFNDEDDND